MRAGWMILMVCVAVSMMPGMAMGGRQQQIDDYLAKVDMGLRAEEELALKRDFVASGALDRLRMEGKPALSEEENRIYAYLTRPVRAKDEANPRGQRPLITVYCPDEVPEVEAEALLSSRGLTLVRKAETPYATTYRVEAPPGVDAVRLARELEEEGQILWPRPHFTADVPSFIVDAQAQERRRGRYIAKNRACCVFMEPIGAEELIGLAASAGLVVLTPRVDFEAADSSWTTNRATFFVADSATVGEVVDRLWAYPNVASTGPDGWVTMDTYIPERENPGDPNYASIPASSQWYFLQNRSANGSDSNDDDSRDFDVDAAEGWHLQTGSGSTIVAVIDAGFDMDHPELDDRWWVNTLEAEGQTGVDNDGNGYMDDIHGANLADPAAPIPDHYHGTMVSGLVGATTNNDTLVAGSNWGCQIMALRIDISAPVEVMNEQTRLGTEYAMAKGARVINMSLSLQERYDPLATAIAAAWSAGIVLVASSGNDHQGPSVEHYPSDYDNVLEVAGTADDNRRYYIGYWDGSGWGTGDRGPDLCAPGEDLLVLTTGGIWTDGVYGTSLSAPIVSGLAALVMDQYGLHGQAEAVVRILKGAVDDVHGDVTDYENASSEPQPGPDDLGAGRVNFFKALAPPRVQTVILTQGGSTRFNEGDLNGNSVFNWMDEDIDGDSYANDDDNNDDGDEFMDGPDVDLDQDGAWDEADTNYVLRQEIEPGDLDIWVLCNESMVVGTPIGVDPSVKLVLPDGSELVFASVGSGNDDWDTQWVANDRWHGRVTVTEDDVAKMYGDLRLEISGSADMAGEALDWDLETPGAQGYEYPLHMPGFVASASDPNAGVAKNTTALGQGVWPMAWGVVDVVGRGFNTDVSDPLSVQSMEVTIERGYDNQTVVSGAPMTQAGHDFTYEWDTVADGDSEYEVTLKAYDGGSGQILEDMKRDIVVDHTVLAARELAARLSRGGGREQIPFYHGTWSGGELQVETEPAKPQQGDSPLVDIWLNEPAEVDSFNLRLMGAGPLEGCSLEMVEYDSTTYRWRGAVPFVTWDAMRNRMKGERRC